MNADKASISKIKSVLIIDDDELFLTLIKTFCSKLIPQAKIELFNPLTHGRPAEDFNWAQYDLLFIDYNLGQGENGLDWLRAFSSKEGFPATIMLTAEGNEELAVEAMRVGAQDYMNKLKISIEKLEQAISNAQMKSVRQQQSSTGNKAPHTNIYDKIGFYNKLKDAIKNHAPDQFSCLLQVHIDDYEKIHEKHGLLIADNFATHLALRIGALVGATGHEISITRIGDAAVACLVIRHEDSNGGEKVARLICDQIQTQPYNVDGNKIMSTVSIGIASVNETDSVDALLSRVDRTCRQVSRQGGNSYSGETEDQSRGHPGTDSKPAVRVTSGKDESAQPPPEGGRKKAPVRNKDESTAEAPAKTLAAQDDAGYVIDLPDAIKHNRIQPYFRPFIALSDSASQFEADFFQLRVNVLAVNDAVVAQENLATMKFRSGNPGMLDLWVVRFALTQLLSLNRARGVRKRGLFIRLFEESLADIKLYDWMKSLLAKIKTSNIASTIVFEINPPAFLTYKTNAMNFINQVRDSWGTGFALYDVVNASVFETCQKQAGFEFLEVSMSHKDRNLITSLAESARQAGALTILENIGSAADLNMAIECKFDYGEGDFIQPPLDKLDLVSEVIEIER